MDLRLELHRASLLREDEDLVVYEEFVPLQMHPRLRLISLYLGEREGVSTDITAGQREIITSLANLSSSALCSLTRLGKSSVTRMLEPRRSLALRNTASLSCRNISGNI